ncbi:MAG TPA: hypothetical protein DDW52_00580 [Planctomycetaceae bacterium]|nr:hypothetical protein [Planctomycetaceae bacterium]
MTIRVSIVFLCVLSGLLAQPRSSSAQLDQPKKQAASESKLIRIFALENLQASYAQAAIMPMLGSDSQTILTADEQTNSLLARGTDEDLQVIEAIVQRLDSVKPVEQATDDDMTFVTYELRYAAADEASNLLSGVMRQQRGSSLRISSDNRLNRLFVYGNQTHHKDIQELLNEIDAPKKSGESKVLKFDHTEKNASSWARILMGAANDIGVDLEIMPEMDIAVVRGTEQAVNSFTGSAAQLLKSVDGVSSEAPGVEQDMVVSCVWFVTAEEASELPERYRAIAGRASQFGLSNLKLVSQLMARAQVSSTVTSSFQVGGKVEGDYQFECEGDIGAGTNGQVRLNVNLQVRESAANANPRVGARPTTSQAHVQMQVTPGKPTIIASTPVEGMQSLFVIEVLADGQ